MIPILISTSTFPIQLGDGLPRFVNDLASALTKEYKLTVLAPGAPGALKDEKMGNLDIHRFTYFFPSSIQSLAYGNGMGYNFRSSIFCKLQLFPFIGAQVRATRSLVRRKGIKVVNSHWMIPQGFSSALARGSGNSFYHVLSVHAADVYMLKRLPFGRALARFIMKRTDFVFTAGSQVKKELDQLLSWPSNAVVQPMGVHVNLFQMSDISPVKSPFSDGYLLFFGRFSEKKGISYLLQAMPKVLKYYPEMGLIIIGYGSLESKLRNEVSQFKIESSVHFVGRKNHKEIVGYLKGSKLAVIPSIVDRYGETEGMPTTVIEAMASGTPVVASAVDGIPDVIHHAQNGWLCRAKDPDDLAEKIILALHDQTPSSIIQEARETADRFDWSKVADRYIEVINTLLKKEL